MRCSIRNRPFLDEAVSGDAIVCFEHEHWQLLAIIDGAGHGWDAHRLSVEMADYLERRSGIEAPQQMIQELHQLTMPSIGAAVSIVVIDTINNSLTFAGVGNVSAYLLGHKDHSFHSSDGSVGYNLRRITSEQQALLAGDCIVMHSDGIQSRFFTQFDESCKRLNPEDFVDYIFAHFAKEHDDASCLVYRY
ncbi:SpoIIE family protein phosphatase [Ferrimonas lipolytica]|uniref:SpoIIE family protein phosphatase n=1 Tax=Ferrimonas lipolytica TaxID=2724191 RepID=A0A6H1UGD4_9GAMM|nr:SpoIIE family protein phosphatase [Ferrimonas lipolytica]QIZ77689.1 SpoIIE family protein phosphatase [Ferrimonas lipolytica]